MNKDEVSNSVSLDGEAKMSRVTDEAEPFVWLHNSMDQPDLCRQRIGQESCFSLANPNDPKPTVYVIDQIIVHGGAGIRTEHKVQWCGCSAKDDTYERA